MPPLDVPDRPLRILAVSKDPQLQEELDEAMAGLKGARAVTFQADGLHRGIEAARARQPDVICVDMEVGLQELRAFVQELKHSAPGAVVTGVFDRTVLDEDAGEGRIFIEAMRANVSDFLRRPVSSAELAQVLARSTATEGARAPARLGRVISVVSTKGGVGKSTIAANLACALGVRHPDQVLLIDASLQLGVCASMLDIEAPATIADAARELDRLDASLLRRLAASHPAGVRLLASPTDAVDAIEVTEDRFARILSVARRAFDFVVVDTFPLIDGVVLGALDLSDLVYVVAQPSVPSVVGIARLLEVLDGLGVHEPRRRLILNNTFPRLSGRLRPADVERRLGGAVRHVVPYDSGALHALNTGRPLALHRTTWFGFGRAMRTIADEAERSELREAAPPAEAAPAEARPESVPVPTGSPADGAV